MTRSISATLHAFDGGLSELISLPGDSRYAGATEIWAKPTGNMPHAVIHCQKTTDIQAGIRAARELGLPVSVRVGGHDWAARALCDGIVLDLRGMNRASVQSTSEIEALGGARASDVASAAASVGAAAVTGSVGAVGMAGLTLGGGYGPLIGRFGLALDNLLAAEVVLADGRVVRADARAEPELFWALRGGGGNFGVVASMRLRVHRLASACAGILFYPFQEAKAVLERCAEITAAAPEELTVQVGLGVDPTGAVLTLIVPTWCGEPNEGERRLAPFLKLGTLIGGTVEAMPFSTLLTLYDPLLSYGLRVHMETCWLHELDSSAIDVLIAAMEAIPSPGCAVFTHEFRGAASRVPQEATAFGLRRDHVLVEILASSADREGAGAESRHRHWARATRQALDTIALPGGYPNLLAGTDTDRATLAFGSNGPRLAAAKKRYDPDNVFSSAIPLPHFTEHCFPGLRKPEPEKEHDRATR